MLARVPVSGSPVRDRQGHRPSARLTIRDQVRAAAAAGTPKPEIARAFRITTRTVYRYLAEPEDALRAIVTAVLEEARVEYELPVTRDEVGDIADAIVWRLRRRGIA